MINSINCHCLSFAYKYNHRKFINKLNHEVTRVYYKCCNCGSRMHRDYNPELDRLETIDVVEYLNKIKNGK